MSRLPWVLSVVFLLAACGERPQEARGSRSDTPSHAGTGVGPFTAPDWKPGDKASWEAALRARAQYGQNDYNPSRAN